ncbi:hypothetical protein [Flavobacterium sp.]|jgi:hypothetical protein|uniref:hypothetical protein n=1 Tax=Flavobacterium sp. TaxID=239 RepID=UPI002FDA6729
MIDLNLILVKKIYKNLDNVVVKIFNSLDMSNVSDSEKNNIEIYKILENPKDEILFNETVEYLRKNKKIKQKEISLSNKESLIISIE